MCGVRCAVCSVQCVGLLIVWADVGGEFVDSYFDHVPAGGDNLTITVRSIS